MAKGLRILSLFTENRPTWRVSDIAPAVGMPPPTVYLVVMTLTAGGYPDHLAGGDYRPGAAVSTLGTAALASLDLVQVATPSCANLPTRPARRSTLRCSPQTGCSTWSGCATPIWSPPPSRSGRPLPAVHTSIDKLLLAYLDEDDLTSRIDTDSFAGNAGPNAKQTLDELRGELSRIRADGWALQDEELAFGLRSVAAPGRDACGAVIAGANIAVQARDWSARRIVSASSSHRSPRPASTSPTCSQPPSPDDSGRGGSRHSQR